MRRTRELTLALLVAASSALAPRVARAGDKDADGLVAFAEGLSDMMAGKAKDAQKKLEDALKACAGNACEPSTRAQLWVAIGIVEGSANKDHKKAVAAFEAALKEDPKVVPDKQFMNFALNKLFAEAVKNAKKASAGAGATRPPPSKEQMAAVNTAQTQLNQKDWSTCMATVIAAMGESEFAAGKLVLARCEDAGGLVLEATADAKLAQKYAEEEGNADLKKKAAELLVKLANDTPTIVVQMPKTVDEAQLFVDGVLIPADKADKPIPHNPGKAVVEVKGKKGTFPFEFKETETFDRGEQVKVNVEAAGGGANASAIQQCLQGARNAADLQRCIDSGGKGRGLTVRTGLEVASYNDTVNVDVFAPTLFFSIENPTLGFSVGATYGVDVVSNASPDIVATASRRFDEIRHAATLAAEVKAGPVRIGLDGGISIEPDYFGKGVGLSLSSDVYNKQITPTLAYHLGFDAEGRCGGADTGQPGAAGKCTPFSVFERTIFTHTIDLGSSFIISPTTVLVFGATAAIVQGDTSKPYRYIPIFDQALGTAGLLPRGATADLVNAQPRIAFIHEQVPTSRDRFALLGRLAHRFEKATIRADERLYADNWGLKASTTDARYLHDVTKSVRIGPHVRFHVQNGASFWQRAYQAQHMSTSPLAWSLPTYRTLDRELSPFFAATGGLSFRWQANEIFSINVLAEAVYTQFLDAIYVYDQVGFFSATTLELGFE